MIVRNQQDIDTLREGGARHAHILKLLSAMVAPGVSTQELEDEARRLIAEGGDTPAFLNYTPDGARRPYPAALCVSINDAIVHGIPNEDPQILQEGDLVTLDLGLVHNGLITDAAVSINVGGVHAENSTLIRVALEALDAGIGAAKAGNTIGDIGHAIESVATKYKLNYPAELCGHSVGINVHEEPLVPNFGDPGTGEPLVDGMVIAIEPMFMLGKSTIKLDADGYTYRTKDGSKAVHAEHTVLVTPHGAEVLTKAKL